MNIKNLLRGAGSVLNIWPAHRHERLYQRVRFHKTISEAFQADAMKLRGDWEKIVLMGGENAD